MTVRTQKMNAFGVQIKCYLNAAYRIWCYLPARGAKLTHEYDARSRVVVVYKSTYVMTVPKKFDAVDVQTKSHLNAAYRGLCYSPARSAELTHGHNPRGRAGLVYKSTYVMTVRTQKIVMHLTFKLNLI